MCLAANAAAFPFGPDYLVMATLGLFYAAQLARSVVPSRSRAALPRGA